MDITLKLGDVETTALIPVAIKANESLRPNARIYDEVAVKMVQTLNIDTNKFDKFLSHKALLPAPLCLTGWLRNMCQTIQMPLL